MFGDDSLQKALKENIKNYELSSLYDIEKIQRQIDLINKLTGVGILVTNRHGDKCIKAGWKKPTGVDVDMDPGVKMRIQDRTVAHVYVDCDELIGDPDVVEELLDNVVRAYEKFGQYHYELSETSMYVARKDKDALAIATDDGKCDPLTGTFNKTYFDNRVKIMDRSQMVPVASVCININDWKYVYDNFGIEESDRLIKTISGIILSEAKTDYIVGKVDGDVFNVLISMPLEGEIEDFCDRVRKRCMDFEDKILAPSVAIGYAVKENVEQSLTDVYSDAEYNMFENKIEVKNAPGYRARLEHGKL